MGKIRAVEVGALRCEYQQNPIGIDVPTPRLSWMLDSDRQVAYQVIVDEDWDSGQVMSDQSVGIEYAGKPLVSGTRYSWKVRVWGADGKPSAWSQPAEFVTGPLGSGDWHGKWIGAGADVNHAAVYLRRELDVSKPVARATVFFCGLGFSELAVDGKKVGDYVIGPGFTTYDKRVGGDQLRVASRLNRERF